MAKYRVTAPDGATFEVTAPDSASEAEVMAYAQQQFARAGDTQTPEAPSQSAGLERTPGNYAKVAAGGFAQQTKDLLGGAVRGAGSIGATLLAPQDALEEWIARTVHGKELPALDRRKAMTDATRELGANPDSMTYGAAKLGTEIAGTAGVGPAMASAVPARAATAMPGIVNALQSAGMTTGGRAPGALNLLKDIGTRSLAGGIVGGASTGLIDPEHAGTGAMIGAAMPPALKVAGEVGKGVAKGATGLLKHVLGLATGVGPVPLSEAYKAGKVGSKDFADNITGNVPLTDVLDRAKQGLAAMSAAKSAEYRAGMIPVGNDKTALGFAGIDKALADAAAVTAYKGQVKNESAARVVAKMRDIVDEWKGLDPAQYHTPEGLDALKQKLGSVLESTPFEERTARLAAGKIYNATKAEIEAQAPSYAAVMKDYSDAATQITEIERALSLGSKSAKDTAMRKLQSLMRNNVQTNYGNRLSLARELEQNGGVELMPALSGQALNSWTPRSLAGQIGGGATAFASMSNPAALLALPFQSPRIVGNAAYGLGRLSGAVGHGAQGLLPHNALTALGGPNALEQIIYRATPAGLAVGR